MIDPATRHLALRRCRAVHADDPVQAEPCAACLAAALRARAQAERQQIEAAAAGPG